MGHDSDMGPQAVCLIFFHISSIQADRSFCGIVETGNQIYKGRFPRSGSADDTDGLAPLCPEGNIGQGLACRSFIRKRDMGEFQERSSLIFPILLLFFSLRLPV